MSFVEPKCTLELCDLRRELTQPLTARRTQGHAEPLYWSCVQLPPEQNVGRDAAVGMRACEELMQAVLAHYHYYVRPLWELYVEGRALL